MKLRERLIGLLLLSAVFCLIVPVVQAADVSVGTGPAVLPEYEGSKDYMLLPIPVPFVNVKFDNGMFIDFFGSSIKANLVPGGGMWQLGPAYKYRLARRDVKNDAVDDMKSLDVAHELGIFGGLAYKKWFVSLDLLSDMADTHDGWSSRLKGGYNWVIDKRVTLSMGAFTTYADDDYMQTYFGVSGKDSQRSGLDRYNADAGIKDVGITLALNWVITQNWSVRSANMYTRLLGDASDDSPVVDEGSEDQFLGVVLAVYSF